MPINQEAYEEKREKLIDMCVSELGVDIHRHNEIVAELLTIVPIDNPLFENIVAAIHTTIETTGISVGATVQALWPSGIMQK